MAGAVSRRGMAALAATESEEVVDMPGNVNGTYTPCKRSGLPLSSPAHSRFTILCETPDAPSVMQKSKVLHQQHLA
jgi:hypothetical protein